MEVGSTDRGQSGLSLIEVMVSIVIMSVGLLGIAGLQLKALKNTYASFQRSVATLQAQDLSDRLWASTCIFSNSAKLDLIKQEWRAAHSTSAATKLSMPEWFGDFTPPDANNLFIITIQWKDVMVNQSGNTGETQAFTQVVRIPTVTCG
jgi:type IV pilus assembly protein PilV